MLTKIENSEIKTVSEFRTIYPDKWFYYVIVEKEEDCMYAPSSYNLKAKVIYTADSKEEFFGISDEEFLAEGFSHFGIKWGIKVNPEPGIQIGSLEVEWVSS